MADLTSARLCFSFTQNETADMMNEHPGYLDCVAFCCAEDYYGDLEEMLLMGKGPHTAWTGVCNRTLGNKLRGRQKSLPPPDLVAMASDGRYFVRFADGAFQCSSDNLDNDFLNIVHNIPVRSVSFGAGCAFAIVDSTGSIHFGGRPHSGVVGALRKANGRAVQCIGLNPEHAQSYVIGFVDGGIIGFGNKELAALSNKVLAPGLYVKSAHLGAWRTYVLQILKKPTNITTTTTIPSLQPTKTVTPEAPVFDVTDARAVGIDLGYGRYYFGPVRNNNQRHGQGVCVYDSTNNNGTRWMAGTFVGDCVTSKTTILETTSGAVYRGGMLNGKYSGGGCLIGDEDDNNNTNYSHCGVFADDKACGVGVRNYHDGRYTIGYFEKGTRDGQALTIYKEGDERLMFRGSYKQDSFADNATIIYTKMRQPPLNPTTSELDYCTRILARAQHLLNGSDLVTTTRVADISPNNKALCSFIRGLRVLRDDLLVTDETLPLDGVFAWHGSNAAAINSIMDTNFDTRLRRLQNQGPGEYLAYNYQDALAFSKDASLLVLTYTPRGPHLATTEDFCLVVKNPPSHSKIAFTYPVLIVKVSDSAPRFNQPKWGLRWQFCFEGDEDQQWIPYTPQVNAILCEASSRKLAKNPIATSTCVIRCLKMSDGRTETYEINLHKYTQRNVRTNYIRKIRFVKVPAAPLGDAPVPPIL